MAKTGRNPLTNTLEDAVQHREIWPTPCPGTHARGAYPHKGVVKSLLEGEKPSTQALLVDKVAVDAIKKGHGFLDPDDNMRVKMWPTPTVGMVEGGEQSDRVEKTEKGSYILRKKNKPESTFGPTPTAKLSDAILFEEKKKLWPTPRANNIVNKRERLTPRRTALERWQTEVWIESPGCRHNVADAHSLRREKVGGRDQSDEKKSGRGGDHEGRGGENARRKPHSQENETLDS